MKLTLRLENKNDYQTVEHLTREAFWDVYQPGCVEHLLLHKLRTVDAYLPALDYVAIADGEIVGNIVYSKSKIVDKEKNAHDVITFGPISVLPSMQNKGIGTALIEHTVKKAKQMGYKAILILGNPDYYHKFGFQSAENFNISLADGTNFDAFMAMELYPDALKNLSGTFHEDPVFEVNQAEVDKFDANFPYREKHVTDTQLH